MKSIHHKKILLFCLFTLSFVQFHCAGGGTDVDNAIVQGVVTVDQKPAAKVSVFCMHSQYNPMKEQNITKTWQTETDSKGHFEIQDLPTGKYSLEFHLEATKHMDWKPNWELKAGQVMEINGELKKAHTLNIDVPDSLISEDLYLYIPGSNSLSLAQDHLMDTTHVILQHVAEVDIPLILYGYAFDPGFTPQVLIRDLPAPQEDTVYVTP